MSTASYGNYWLKMTKYNKRGTCPKCDAPETMQHILFNCNANQSKIIWKIAETISECKNIQWPSNLDVTTIMALLLLKVHNQDGQVCNGATCLFLITISECTYLIWKLRCKRILDTTPDEPTHTISPKEAHSQMLSIINSRLNQDKILTSKKRYGVGRIKIQYPACP